MKIRKKIMMMFFVTNFICLTLQSESFFKQVESRLDEKSHSFVNEQIELIFNNFVGSNDLKTSWKKESLEDFSRKFSDVLLEAQILPAEEQQALVRMGALYYFRSDDIALLVKCALKDLSIAPAIDFFEEIFFLTKHEHDAKALELLKTVESLRLYMNDLEDRVSKEKPLWYQMK